MIRRSLFLGLTLVLVAALIILIIRSRRFEKEQARQTVEVVQQSQPTLTRVFAPQDLQITQASMQLENGAGKLRTARHELEIHNSGSMPYMDIRLKFDYTGRRGRELATRTQAIRQKILPGASLRLSDIRMTDIPASVTDSKVTIVSADLTK